jgi:hypothetical protein
VSDQRKERLQYRCACADLVGRCRQAEIDALPPVALALPVQRLMLAELLEPRGVTWNGAGGCVIVSHSRHENFSRTVWITFHWRGIISSVSVMSCPASPASSTRRSPDLL